jgi:uncharacterized membrane protein YccC
MREAVAGPGRGDPVLIEILGHADALLGQLRASVEIVNAGSPAGAEQSARAEAARPVALRPEEPISILRANLTLRSASFRHALRLAVTLAIATALARQFGLARAYWVPLTVAIVLKPDFTSTFTRGVLRLVGTMLGLGLATFLVHVVSGDVPARIVLIGLLTFLIRSVGPAHFGLSAVAITALVVFVTSFVGARPEATICNRGVDTVIGGLLSLVVYALWPTWERARTTVVLADTVDAYRRYFDMVMSGYLDPPHLNRAELDRVRLEARLARSHAEASADRMRSEPADSSQDLHRAYGILANSHRFIHSAMILEASLYTPTEPAALQGLAQFVSDVDTTLERLSSALRRSSHSLGPVPDLRADQNVLVEAADSSGRARAPLLLETERITNSLNTMVDVVQRPGADPGSPPAERRPEHGMKYSV